MYTLLSLPLLQIQNCLNNYRVPPLKKLQCERAITGPIRDAVFELICAVLRVAACVSGTEQETNELSLCSSRLSHPASHE